MADDPTEMAALARRCRRLARSCSASTKNALTIMADDYDARESAAKAPNGRLSDT
jgi:hypothetical protein